MEVVRLHCWTAIYCDDEGYLDSQKNLMALNGVFSSVVLQPFL